MKLILYNNHSESNKLNKTLIKIIELEGVLREPTSLTTPNITIELNPQLLDDNYVVDNNQAYVKYNEEFVSWDYFIYHNVLSANYCYIPYFNRYYYVEEIISVRNNLWQIVLKVDVLMSFASKIREQKGYISRNENDYDEFLIDNQIPMENEPLIDVVSTTTIFSTSDVDTLLLNYYK